MLRIKGLMMINLRIYSHSSLSIYQVASQILSTFPQLALLQLLSKDLQFGCHSSLCSECLMINSLVKGLLLFSNIGGLF